MKLETQGPRDSTSDEQGTLSSRIVSLAEEQMRMEAKLRQVVQETNALRQRHLETVAPMIARYCCSGNQLLKNIMREWKVVAKEEYFNGERKRSEELNKRKSTQFEFDLEALQKAFQESEEERNRLSRYAEQLEVQLGIIKQEALNYASKADRLVKQLAQAEKCICKLQLESQSAMDQVRMDIASYTSKSQGIYNRGETLDIATASPRISEPFSPLSKHSMKSGLDAFQTPSESTLNELKHMMNHLGQKVTDALHEREAVQSAINLEAKDRTMLNPVSMSSQLSSPSPKTRGANLLPPYTLPSLQTLALPPTAVAPFFQPVGGASMGAAASGPSGPFAHPKSPPSTLLNTTNAKFGPQLMQAQGGVRHQKGVLSGKVIGTDMQSPSLFPVSRCLSPPPTRFDGLGQQNPINAYSGTTSTPDAAAGGGVGVGSWDDAAFSLRKDPQSPSHTVISPQIGGEELMHEKVKVQVMTTKF